MATPYPIIKGWVGNLDFHLHLAVNWSPNPQVLLCKCAMRQNQVGSQGFHPWLATTSTLPSQSVKAMWESWTFPPPTKGDKVSLSIQSSEESGLCQHSVGTCVVSMEATWGAKTRHPSCPNQGSINRGLVGSLNLYSIPRSNKAPFPHSLTSPPSHAGMSTEAKGGARTSTPT